MHKPITASEQDLTGGGSDLCLCLCLWVAGSDLCLCPGSLLWCVASMLVILKWSTWGTLTLSVHSHR